jgi:ATP-dependent DNA helicase RecG
MLHIEHAAIPIDVLEEMIALGVSYKTEFHESIPSSSSLAQTIGAFANCKGGTVFMGISSTGVTVDVGDKYALAARIEEAQRLIQPRPALKVQAVDFKNREIILLKVPEGDSKPYYMEWAEGKLAFVRTSTGNVPATKKELKHISGR